MGQLVGLLTLDLVAAGLEPSALGEALDIPAAWHGLQAISPAGERVWCGVVWCGYGMWYGAVRCGYGLDMVWHDMVCVVWRGGAHQRMGVPAGEAMEVGRLDLALGWMPAQAVGQ
jgi:hypothetical protein